MRRGRGGEGESGAESLLSESDPNRAWLEKWTRGERRRTPPDVGGVWAEVGVLWAEGFQEHPTEP